MPVAENGKAEEQESVPGGAQPEPIRVKVEIPTPTVVGGSTNFTLSASGGAVSSAGAKLTVVSSTGVTEEVETDLSRPIDPEYDNEYLVRVTGGPGDWLEAAVHREDGKMIAHTLQKSGVTTGWAAVEVVDQIAEALITDIEGLPE